MHEEKNKKKSSLIGSKPLQHFSSQVNFLSVTVEGLKQFNVARYRDRTTNLD